MFDRFEDGVMLARRTDRNPAPVPQDTSNREIVSLASAGGEDHLSWGASEGSGDLVASIVERAPFPSVRV